MTIEQILELGKMGYTKADIEAMNSPTPEKQEEPAPAQETTAKQVQPALSSLPSSAEQPEAPKAPASSADAVSEAINKAFDEQVKKMDELYKKMATLAGMPSIEGVQAVDVADVIAKFFE